MHYLLVETSLTDET